MKQIPDLTPEDYYPYIQKRLKEFSIEFVSFQKENSSEQKRNLNIKGEVPVKKQKSQKNGVKKS